MEEIEHFKSLEFRERLIVDYLNVLEEQKELLESRLLKLAEPLQKPPEPFVDEKKKVQDQVNRRNFDMLLVEPIESWNHRPRSPVNLEQEAIEIIHNKIINVKTKLQEGRKLLEFVERRLLLEQDFDINERDYMKKVDSWLLD